jgi:proline dehydrogenase
MLRSAVLVAARSGRVRGLVQHAPVTRSVVRRFVAGQHASDAAKTTADLLDAGLLVSLDYLGEDTLDREQAAATRDAYRILLGRLAEAGLQDGAEVSVKLSAIGQALPQDGAKIALEHARSICEQAGRSGMTVTLDMEDHTTTDATLQTLRELRVDFPWVGAVLQSYLRRTEADCRDLATPGSRVRLCKGAYNEPASVAFQRRTEVDLSYVRCLKVLMAGAGYPMAATHDPRLIELTDQIARRHGRDASGYEHQMLFGVRPDEQLRLARAGRRVRVYVPYGDQWYGYLMRRLAERPANLAFFLRALATRG